MKNLNYLGLGISFGKTRSSQPCPYCGEFVKEGLSTHTTPTYYGNWDRVWFHEKCLIKEIFKFVPFQETMIRGKSGTLSWGWGKCLVCGDNTHFPDCSILGRGIHNECMCKLLRHPRMSPILLEVMDELDNQNEIIAKLI